MNNLNSQFNNTSLSTPSSLSTLGVDRARGSRAKRPWLVVAILIFIALGAMGYWWWKNQISTPPSTLPEGEGTLNSPLGGGTEGVEDWQTYWNEEYGFEFKYPTLGSVSEHNFTTESQVEVNLLTDEDRRDGSNRTFLVRVENENDNSCIRLSRSGNARTINGIVYDYGEEFSGGIQSKGKIHNYKTINNNICFTITLYVHGPRYYGNELDGTGDLLGRTGITPAFNFEQEFLLLEKILFTFRFID